MNAKMSTMRRNGHDYGRVGVWLFEDTRNRLNEIKAGMREDEGGRKSVYLDDVVNMLIDHYQETRTAEAAATVEFA